MFILYCMLLLWAFSWLFSRQCSHRGIVLPVDNDSVHDTVIFVTVYVLMTR